MRSQRTYYGGDAKRERSQSSETAQVIAGSVHAGLRPAAPLRPDEGLPPPPGAGRG